MKRLLFLIAISVLFLVSQAVVQSPALLEVTEFTGGLVNSIENSLMQPNQARVLVNYDIKKGKLIRRQGVRLQYPDANSGQTMSALLPFYRGLKKEVLTIRKLAGKYGDDRDSLYHLTICTPENGRCTTVVFQGYLPFERESRLPFNITYDYMNGGMLIAATQSEPLVFDSAQAIPLRPMGMGQPKAIAMGGSGNVTGLFRYKYAYGTGVEFPVTDPTSNMSSPSWEVKVTTGKVVVFNMAPVTDSVALDWCYIFREENYNQDWELVDSIRTFQAKPMTYIDNKGSTVDADTTDFPWGNNIRNRPITDVAPGGITVTLDTILGDTTNRGIGIREFKCAVGTACTLFVAYAITQVDTFGMESMICPPTYVRVSGQATLDTLSWTYKATITGFKAPVDSGINKYWLLRTYVIAGGIDSFGTEGLTGLRIGDWYRLYSFTDITVANLKDSALGVTKKDSLFCLSNLGISPLIAGRFAFGEQPESTCVIGDSIIPCRPGQLMYHGFRVYMIDDCGDGNDLVFSEFNSFSQWDPDKRINLPARTGDWLHGLLSLTSNRFLGFRQNSAIQVSGNSFFQFTVDETVRGLGAVAPRSITYSRNRGGFLYYDGYYLFDQTGSILTTPLTAPISNSVDSADSNIIRGYANFVGSELWLSLPIGGSRNTHTYIFEMEAPQHWKSYDFGVIDMIPMDVDTTIQNFRPGRWLMILDNDSMYNWGVIDTAFDNKGGDTILARYESKFFFDDNQGIRERVFTVDIYGEATSAGANDSLWIIVSQNKGNRADTVLIIPDFTDEERDMAAFNVVCDNFSIGWYDNGIGDYSITGYKVEGAGWDKGRKP